MSSSVSLVKWSYGNAGYRWRPSRSTPSRIARANASCDQRPMPVSASGVMLVPWIVPKGVLIGVPPAYALPPSSVWQPRQLLRCASSAPFATTSRGNDGGCCSGCRRSYDAQPAKPVSTASAASSAAPPMREKSVALRRIGRVGAGHGDAVFVDHFATEPAGDHEERKRDERQPHQSAGVLRLLPAHDDVDDVKRDDRQVERHVLDRGRARALGQGQEVDQPGKRREQRADDAPDHAVERDGGPRLRRAAEAVDQVADEREDPQPDRNRHEHRMDRMAGNAGWSLHRCQMNLSMKWALPAWRGRTEHGHSGTVKGSTALRRLSGGRHGVLVLWAVRRNMRASPGGLDPLRLLRSLH